ncbi:MAG: hypothetical protein HY216_05360, partial [Candidatus Rokubacteria bacterium]|nr:hypothetical protein [Candidatus Rokubacteria bacterium]
MTAGSPMDRPWLLGAAIVALGALVYGAVLRFTGLPGVFCRTPDELAEMMPGLRLHVLPLLARGGPDRLDVAGSLFYSQHGLGDVSFYYLASLVLGWLRVPISERNLFIVGGITNIALAVVGGLFCARVLRRRGMGLAFAVFVLVSPVYVFVSQSGWARLTWTPLLLFLLFLAQERATTTRRTSWTAAFVGLAGFISLTDGFVAFPLLPVLALLLAAGSPRERLSAVARDRRILAGVAAFAA